MHTVGHGEAWAFPPPARLAFLEGGNCRGGVSKPPSSTRICRLLRHAMGTVASVVPLK